MKSLFALCIFFFVPLSDLHSQDNSTPAFFKDIPFDLHLQIGFLFVYILLGLLFFMLFVFSPRQQLNFFFSLYNISLALMILNIQFLRNDAYDIANIIISRLIGINILLFILYALGRIKPFYYWFIAFLLFIDLPLGIFLREKHSMIPEILHPIFTLTCFWLAITAFRNKKAGDWLIGMVALAVVVINASSTLSFFGNIQLVSYAAMGVIPFIITVSVVIYLALRYGRTNSILEQQLKRVQVLSEENLRSEKEKQQILEGQNELLEKQVTERTTALTKSLNDLKSAQSQLIQSEKMASLGELTAGIAHEIQNPLNFVNNFSEVSAELVAEIQEARTKKQDHIDIILENEILNDVKQNLEKIAHHGKRADAIVKGMLEHSRASSGEKVPTDINALAEEFLRLSYHGMRAKDKNFKAEYVTDFDQNLPKVNVVPQDIGRVLLNIINNAFYACSTQPPKGGVTNATVKVKTKVVKSPSGDLGVEISVKDNGPGIPDSIKDKIFQPFFTTKPTGEGTGLGLSLSYDIVKAHGGEIRVESKIGEGTTFTIILIAS